MSQTTVNQALNTVMANTYTLYLKTQNYHWHVSGANFKSLHVLFEEQYQSLALAVDTIAERIVTMGGKSPATFVEFIKLKTINEGRHDLSAHDMVKELHDDQNTLLDSLIKAVSAAEECNDEGSVDMLGGLIGMIEKHRWMLASSL